MINYEILKKIGFLIDQPTGHIYYGRSFHSLKLQFELIFIRHGETYGNCGQCTETANIDFKCVQAGIKNSCRRVYQGDIDTEINQLTELGKQQALEVAITLEEKFLKMGWIPDVIFSSPLTRAKQTSMPFVERNHFNDRYRFLNDIKEMSFGCWENRRICDMPSDHHCHLFYRDQNTLIKESGTNGSGVFQEAENFCDVMIRAYRTLWKLEHDHRDKKIILFSHSMFGAACCMLLGLGQKVEDAHHLAFDGQRRDGTHYTMPHTTPICLNRTSTTSF